MSGVTTAPRILLIEDDASVRIAVESALRSEGYEVRSATGSHGLDEVVASFCPDLAVLDVGLGEGMDGFGVARYLRGSSDAAIVFVTAADAIEDRLRGFDSGGD